MDDTSDQAAGRYVELLRAAGPAKRLAICASLTRATRELALAGIKAAHADRTLSARELRRELGRRLYGDEVARRLFGERPA